MPVCAFCGAATRTRTASTRRRGELDAGLFFICFQRDPHVQFAALQRRLGSGDALNEYIKHTSSAVFAIPAGVSPGRYLAEGLFA